MNSDIVTAKFTDQCNFTGQVFFYLSPQGFPHLSICLAEGFKELGIRFYSNINFWQASPDREEYLFCHDPSVTPDDCSVVVLNKDWNFYGIPFPENLFQPTRKYITVYLDDMDGSKPSLYPHISEKFDFIFKTHCNKGIHYPDNYKPWAFGLSNRILREINSIPHFKQRRRTLLANFRVLQDRLRISNRFVPVNQGLLQVEQGVIIPNYPVRQLVREHFFPLMKEILQVDDTVEHFDNPPSDSYHYLQWKQTGRRHYPNYYERMKLATACAAFGGWMVPEPAVGKTFIEWWDSWRFWESLAAGCVTIHVDLAKYGILLPVMPENWHHYIGVDLDNLQSAVDRIANEPGILEKISTQSRQWVLENYSPIPTALQFLKAIGLYSFSGCADLNIQENKVSSELWESVTDCIPVNLKEINLIIFPDWFVPEESLRQELEEVIRAIATHPAQRHMTLLVDASQISEEDAELALSGIIMNLLMEEDLDVADHLEISLLGELSEMQWNTLSPCLQARIILKNENHQARSQTNIQTLPSYEIPSLKDRQLVSFYFDLSNKLFQEGRWHEAIKYYQKIIELHSGDAALYWRLSECFRQLNLLNKSINALQEGIRLFPREGRLHFTIIVNLQLAGYIQEAISRATTASILLPNDYTFKLLKNLIVPVIYNTQDEISFYRQRFVRGLQALIHQTLLETAEERKNAMAGIGRVTNFYLSYQAQNDRELQRQYGNLVYKIMAANYPNWAIPLSVPAFKENNKIRIGYVSAYLHSYSGTLWLTGWLRHCDRQSFEVYCYYTGNTPDSITQQFEEYSDVFHYIPHNLEAACKQIVAEQLHILVFPEIGMDAQTLQMASLRLAPVQCTAWGHPVTSGLPTIDYYLSSDLMEPENARSHYSETLIRLPNLGVSYPKPDIPQLTKNKIDFQIQDNTVVYLCCQAPFKYLPQHDFIFTEIAQRVPQAQFVFIRAELIKARLHRIFAAVGLNSEDYCIFLPAQSRADYLMLNLLADIYLDSLGFSGGNTTFDALACNLPVVTCPGEFMRSRLSYAMLRMISLTETVAANEAEYIEIAVKLGRDPIWRHNLAERIKERNDSLYNDRAYVASLEAFYKQVILENLTPLN